MTSQFTDDQLKAIEKVKKLMALAAGNANENEAAAATERANFILAQMNLSMEELKASSGQDTGGRKKDRLVGGFYQHERDMWKAIAELNFCFYATVKVHYDEETAKRERRKYAHHHQLIGRSVNILATQLMADYLLQTLERLTREYCDLERPFEKWHPRSSTAISFRKGAAIRLIEKINARRGEIILEERRKEREAAEAAKASGTSRTVGALTVISNIIKSEYQANFDFKYGEGAYQRSLERSARYAEEERQLQEAHDKRYASDPAYKKQYDREQAKWERKYSRRSQPRFNGDSKALTAGYRAAGSVSLDSQIGSEERKALN